LKVNRGKAVTVPNLRSSSVTAENRRRNKSSVAPRDVDYNSSACTQAANRADWPSRGKRRQKLNLARLRLQQHLGNAGCARGISVDRENILFGSGNATTREGEQTGIYGFSEKANEIFMRVIALQQARVVDH
jgi:hypothetical protein